MYRRYNPRKDTLMHLTDTRVRNAKSQPKTYKLSDGGGMYLLVTAGGGRYWRLTIGSPGNVALALLASIR